MSRTEHIVASAGGIRHSKRMANNRPLRKSGIHSTRHLASALRELAWIFLFAALTQQSRKEFGKSQLNKKPIWLLWAVDIQKGHFHEHGRICTRSFVRPRARFSACEQAEIRLARLDGIDCDPPDRLQCAPAPPIRTRTRPRVSTTEPYAPKVLLIGAFRPVYT